MIGMLLVGYTDCLSVTCGQIGGLTLLLIAVSGVLVMAFQAVEREKIAFPKEHWETRSPSQLGINPAALERFKAHLNIPEAAGVVVRNGYLADSWGQVDGKIGWMSATKPVFSTLLFFAIERGLLRGADDLVGKWGWNLSPKDRTMTFRHLANMVSGYACQDPPGVAWAYNDFAIKLFHLTLERVFGKGLNDIAADCFAPLGLENGELFETKLYHVKTTPRDFARIGWFWMNRGMWDNRQVLPSKYFDAYMKPDVPADLPGTATPRADDYLKIGSFGGSHNQTLYDGRGAYGFCWWFNTQVGTTGRRFWPDAPADAVLCIGYGGKVLVMLPSRGLMAAVKGNWGNPEPGKPEAIMNQALKLLADCVSP